LLRGIGWFEAFNSGQIDELAVRVRNHCSNAWRTRVIRLLSLKIRPV
jgi:hypothetical protein